MARKNMFEGLEPREEDEIQVAAEPPTPAPAPSSNNGSSGMGALGALSMDLSGRNSRMIQNLDPSVIEGSGHRDRLDIEATDIDALADSLSEFGQQVPILVRPLKDKPGRYQIIYGRRRLAAARRAGLQIKAMIRMANEEEAILAQGQENSQRLDPTFIEKALFASDLRQAGYEPGIITAALAVDKYALSRMEKVVSTVPLEWILAIGAAPDIGRRRWLQVARLIDEGAGLPAEPQDTFSQAATSEERFNIFEAFVQSLAGGKAPGDSDRQSAAGLVARGQPEPRKVATPDGRKLAEIKISGTALTMKVHSKQNPEFGSWLEERAGDVILRLFEEWSEDPSGGKKADEDGK